MQSAFISRAHSTLPFQWLFPSKKHTMDVGLIQLPASFWFKISHWKEGLFFIFKKNFKPSVIGSVLSPDWSRRDLITVSSLSSWTQKMRSSMVENVTLLFISFSFCSTVVSVMHTGLTYLYTSVPWKKDSLCGE